jgi:hypothetical protein
MIVLKKLLSLSMTTVMLNLTAFMTRARWCGGNTVTATALDVAITPHTNTPYRAAFVLWLVVEVIHIKSFSSVDTGVMRGCGLMTPIITSQFPLPVKSYFSAHSHTLFMDV